LNCATALGDEVFVIVEILGTAMASAAVTGLILSGLEVQYRCRSKEQLEVTSKNWHLGVYDSQRRLLTGVLELWNVSRNVDIVVSEFEVQLRLLSNTSLNDIHYTLQLRPQRVNELPQIDAYWEAHIIEPAQPLFVQVSIEFTGENLDQLELVWLQTHATLYTRKGQVQQNHHVLIPLKKSIAKSRAFWQSPQADIFPISTHLLTCQDDPIAVVQKYAVPQAQSDDVLLLDATALSMMQGRFFHPNQIRLAKLTKRLFHWVPASSSITTVWGLQLLIETVGFMRVAIALFLTLLTRRFKPFDPFESYAHRIKDVTVLPPPYDQFIGLEPTDLKNLVNRIKKATGLSAAIVTRDPRNQVRVLAATAEVSEPLISQSLSCTPKQMSAIAVLRPAKQTAKVASH
jgi:hypothetical protein